jgi:hypothetical protein
VRRSVPQSGSDSPFHQDRYEVLHGGCGPALTLVLNRANNVCARCSITELDVERISDMAEGGACVGLRLASSCCHVVLLLSCTCVAQNSSPRLPFHARSNGSRLPLFPGVGTSNRTVANTWLAVDAAVVVGHTCTCQKRGIAVRMQLPREARAADPSARRIVELAQSQPAQDADLRPRTCNEWALLVSNQ